MLPTLNPMARLYPTNPDHQGHPQWILHQPLSDKYFKIGWGEFEIISRLHKFESIEALLADINAKTHLSLDSDDCEAIIKFLYMNGLTKGAADAPADIKPQPLWKRMMHGYLYFTLPLFKPQAFLDQTIGYVRPLLGRTFMTLMLFILAAGIIATMPRMDEFFNSFTQIFTLEGIILTAIVYTVIKIIHELAHAYTATKYNVSVPHMGIAFIVLYPIFYTEATGAWRITDKRARINIGGAGVMAELYIAAIALVAWHFTEPGLAQMVAFTTVAISLIGSLLINLNPLMRFDGYYMLSDAVDIENLHSTAIDYARHALRKTVLGLYDDTPHDYPHHTARMLTYFGFAVLIYRFFLFLGIAVLVYAVFFKPLGLILMLFELAWFIGLPIGKELKIWAERYGDYKDCRQYKISLSIVLLIIVLGFVPVRQTLTLPAVSHANQYMVAYAPAPSNVSDIHVQNGDTVTAGDVLITLVSDAVEQEVALTRERLEMMRQANRRERMDFESFRENPTLTDQEIEAAQIAYDAARQKARRLVIRADFDGVITDMDESLRVGQAVNPSLALLRVVQPGGMAVTAYIRESQLNRVAVGNAGGFRPSDSLLAQTNIVITDIETVNISDLAYPSLASPYQGSIPAQVTQDGVKPLVSLYKIMFHSVDKEAVEQMGRVVPGHVVVAGRRAAIIPQLFDKVIQLFRNELSLN